MPNSNNETMRVRLIDSYLDRLADGGGTADIKELAAGCGMSAQAAYRQIHGLDGLTAAARERLWQRMDTELDAAAGRPAPQDQLAALFSAGRRLAQGWRMIDGGGYPPASIAALTARVATLLEDDVKAGRVMLPITSDKAAAVITGLALTCSDLPFADVWRMLNIIVTSGA